MAFTVDAGDVMCEVHAGLEPAVGCQVLDTLACSAVGKKVVCQIGAEDVAGPDDGFQKCSATGTAV